MRILRLFPVLLLPPALQAQEYQTLEPGAVVRVETITASDTPLVGTYWGMRGDAFGVLHDRAALLQIPVTEIESLEMRTGTKGHFWWGALVGGAVTGLAVASGFHQDGAEAVTSPLGFAILGGLVGGVIGSQIRTEQWQPVDPPEPSRVLAEEPRTEILGYPTPDPGHRLRVSTAQDRYAGAYVGSAEDGALLMKSPEGGVLRIPASSIESIEVSQGVQGHFGLGAAIGAGVGLIGGVIWANTCRNTGGEFFNLDPCDTSAETPAVGVMTVTYALLGGLVGSLVRTERWQSVSPSPTSTLQPSLSVDPGTGELGMSVSIPLR
jgi:hypothetical protein